MLLAPVVMSLAATSAHAKETPVTAIALFNGPTGPAYTQIAGVTLNGKSELRICDGVPKFDKRAYDSMARTQLAGATSLERAADGTLLLTTNSKPVCVVPSNLKFDRNAEFTPAEAADQATLQGTAVSASGPGASTQGSDLPPFKRGVRLVFVAAPDEELAQYLLAQRTNSIAAWQDFLLHHGSSAKAVDAKSSLAAIYEESAEAAFAKYQKSANGDLGPLKQAQQQAMQANTVVAGYPAAHKLTAQINKELDALLEADRAKLQGFRKALAEQTAGYAQLAAAKQHNENVLAVDPDYAPVLNLHSEIAGEVRKMDSAIANADALTVTKNYDEALQALGPYRAFASEAPRIDSIVTAAYASHFNHGRALAAEHNWEGAVPEFRRAAEIKNNSQADAELKDAELQLATARNRQAVQRAIAESNDLADNKQFIEAYDVLAELPEGQRALVTEQLTALKKDYVPAAVRRAQKLQEIHVPIRGRADEDAVREAYELLNRAGALSGDPAIKVRLDLLSDKISAYYIDQAKRYLEKPLGSGVGIGWLYLGEAERYKPNVDAVKDAMARYAPAYQLRAKLSVGVVLRDQTSRRESLGFADQLADAIATGLESSGVSIQAVRQPKEGAGTVPPSFVLVGGILEHRIVKDTNLETLQSKYRAGTHEVKNEAWLQANRDYETAQQQLSAAQHSLADAQAQHKKKEIVTAASDAVAAAHQEVEEAHHKLETTDQNSIQSILEPYNYTRKKVDLTAVIELEFRITNQEGNAIEPAVPIRKDSHKELAILENVKPEDTEGIKNQGTEPDQAQFLTDLEIQARDALVKSVREKVMVLPGRILQEARGRAGQGDVDGAAEEYILYLNATADDSSHEREEAAKFLHDHFNVAVFSVAHGTPHTGPAQVSQVK
ncbi:MAG TPA: hypothetical protein VKY85_29010 [Candidatus Angelobacter sp.]|nr:hypothetical protein [Candidatus Angelobacter sp.]